MKLNRNGEGYQDPTAGEALRRAMRGHSRYEPNKYHLTYNLGEIPQFRKARTIIARG